MNLAEPSGYISKPVEAIRLALADAAALRAWLGVDNQADALDRIYLDALPQPPNGADVHSKQELQQYRPFLIVGVPDNGLVVAKRAEAGSKHQTTGGVCHVYFERATPATCENHSQATRTWSNIVGDVLFDMLEITGVYPYPEIGQANLIQAPFRSHWDDWDALGDYQGAEFALDFGPIQ